MIREYFEAVLGQNITDPQTEAVVLPNFLLSWGVVRGFNLDAFLC